MLKKIIILYLLINYFGISAASIKENIISNLIKTNNLTFNFEQTIGEKKDSGKCTIKYPKKIYCTYDNEERKIIVSNGKSLVIKNLNDNQFYLYPLKKTPLELILDKEYIIKKIKNLDSRIIDNKYINFTLTENENIINLFFDKKSLNLMGWQTEDIYQNLVITFISSIKLNTNINEKIFIIPKSN